MLSALIADVVFHHPFFYPVHFSCFRSLYTLYIHLVLMIWRLWRPMAIGWERGDKPHWMQIKFISYARSSPSSPPLSFSLFVSLSLFRFGNLFFSRFPVLPLRLQSKKIPLAQQKPSLLFPLGFLLCLRSLMRFKCFRKCKYSIHATKHTINICKTKNNQLTNTKYPWKIPNDINLSSIYFGQIYFSHYFN